MSEAKEYIFQSGEGYGYRRVTLDDIRSELSDDDVKAIHPKCATCEHCMVHEFYGTHYCINDESVYCATHLAYHDYDECQVDPDLDYCRHHTPKYGDERNTEKGHV